MYKKKEIIIIILIIVFTIILAFIPSIIKRINTNIDENKTEKPIITNTINIHITGEIKAEEIELVIPYGASYGFIISKIDGYLNPYSVIDNDLTKRYYSDTTIIIESTDIKNNYEIIDSGSNLININEATKAELITLYGIGEKRSETIINYRNKKKIESWDELKQLLGVSDEIIKAIKEKAVL